MSFLPPLPPKTPDQQLADDLAARGEHVWRRIGASVVMLDGERYLVEPTTPAWGCPYMPRHCQALGPNGGGQGP